ncbi:methyltransferase domain-containing protein [Streptomyces sp. NPDC127039]|uniref:methyltransferase domain-containing protein n=1 Tax=Streptomyces sp. NPDC127039 TaxID=3347115 RepID=UPI00364DD88B
MEHDPVADVLVLEHTPSDVPDAIGTALESVRLRPRSCRVWAGDAVPDGLDGVAAVVATGGAATALPDLPDRDAELALLRAALAAEVPTLGVCLGARLLAVAAGGTVRRGGRGQVGRAGVRVPTAADPLLGTVPALPWVSRGHDGVLRPPLAASLSASRDRHPVRAFRIGGSAWGLRFPPEAGSEVFARFAALVADRAPTTATRTFFTPRADTWEERFAADGPRYAAAVARMGLRPGQRALDVGCGSGRALPALRAGVGAHGLVLGVDLTAAMLGAAERHHPTDRAHLLLADACRLPLADGSMDGVFSAGLINHVAEPAAALREWARATAPDGVLLLYHPSGRAERAARHGRPLDPEDPLAEANLRPALEEAGWRPDHVEDAAHHFLARAVRAGG